MPVVVTFVLYGIAALLSLTIGLILLKGRSRYPDTSIGYHFAKAVESEEKKY